MRSERSRRWAALSSRRDEAPVGSLAAWLSARPAKDPPASFALCSLPTVAASLSLHGRRSRRHLRARDLYHPIVTPPAPSSARASSSSSSSSSANASVSLLCSLPIDHGSGTTKTCSALNHCRTARRFWGPSSTPMHITARVGWLHALHNESAIEKLQALCTPSFDAISP